MRGNSQAHELVAPGSMTAVLELLAASPGEWMPIAGGTEVMVAFAAGRLEAHMLLSLWGISDLRFIETTRERIVIAAGTTFCDLRAHRGIRTELPLLAKAASWIGSIANQSRATLGGNLVNGSPAADSSPALLVYDAEVELVSVRGSRRISYSAFHTGYKRNALAVDELLYAIHLPLRFARHRQYMRKVGTRRAMAISKVALAATALVENGLVSEICVAGASLAPFPTRFKQAESTLLGQPIDSRTIQSARDALLAEAKPIDDIRSTAEYRRRVAANLLEEFLSELHLKVHLSEFHSFILEHGECGHGAGCDDCLLRRPTMG
jgi:CO/xanthine dehydrogenase FAD-binding subunit